MRRSATTVTLIGTLAMASAAAVMHAPVHIANYDVIVIGGGLAGVRGGTRVVLARDC